MIKKIMLLSLSFFVLYILFINISDQNKLPAGVFQKNDPEDFEIIGDNILINSDFESESFEPWKSLVQDKYVFIVQKNIGMNDTSGFMWEHHNDLHYFSLAQYIERPFPKSVLVECWVKTEDFHCDEKDRFLRILMQGYRHVPDDYNDILCQTYSREGVNETCLWTKLSAVIENIPDDPNMIFFVTLFSSTDHGRVYVDDFKAFPVVRKTSVLESQAIQMEKK